MRIAIVEAARLNRVNRAQQQRLLERHSNLVGRIDLERDAHELRRTNIYYTSIVPFRDAFLRLKNVELSDLAAIRLPAVMDLALSGVIGTIKVNGFNGFAAAAGGAAAGAGAGSAAVAGVGAFAAASTGAPIATLSGAAATNATLAWLGGGSLAAGGGGIAAGTLVLTGVVAAPVLLAGTGYLAWEGRRELRNQRTAAEHLANQEAALSRDELRCDAIIRRSGELRSVLADLQGHIDHRLTRFTETVDRNVDFATYSAAEKALAMTLVHLASSSTTVMATRPANDAGFVTAESGRVVDQARDLLVGIGAGDDVGGDAGTTGMGSAA